MPQKNLTGLWGPLGDERDSSDGKRTGAQVDRTGVEIDKSGDRTGVVHRVVVVPFLCLHGCGPVVLLDLTVTPGGLAFVRRENGLGVFTKTQSTNLRVKPLLYSLPQKM